MRGFAHYAKYRYRLICAVLSLFGLPGCSPQSVASSTVAPTVGNTRTVTKVITDNVSTGGLKILEVRGEVGDIEVTTTNNKVIQIVATKIVSGELTTSELEGYLDKAITTVTRDSRRIKIRANCAPEKFPDNVKAHVNYQFKVPSSLKLDLLTENSRITIKGVSGGMYLRDTNGNIEMTNVGGQIDADTINGSVLLTGARASQIVKLHSADGNVYAMNIKPASSTLKLELVTSNGAVKFTGAASDLTLQTTNGDIAAELKTILPLKTMDIQGTNTPITLTLPATLASKIDANTSGGTIKMIGSYPGTKLSQDQSGMHFSGGMGSGRIKIETSNANISLKRK